MAMLFGRLVLATIKVAVVMTPTAAVVEVDATACCVGASVSSFVAMALMRNLLTVSPRFPQLLAALSHTIILWV